MEWSRLREKKVFVGLGECRGWEAGRRFIWKGWEFRVKKIFSLLEIVIEV